MDNNAALIDLYRRVIEDGKRYVAENAAPNDGGEAASSDENEDTLIEIDKAQLEEYFKRITAACDDFDEDEINAVIEEMSAYSYHGLILREELSEVKSLAEDFEYEQAGIKAVELSEKIG
ncbi:MAG: hypothetical protein LIO69_01580 [Oscillospiraceae bacterium]|nr:hypothetical protein [Oscillospiraceae bacterium]